MSHSLYDIAAQYRKDAETLADLDLPLEVITDTLDGMAGELEVKAQNVVYFARNLQAVADAKAHAAATLAAQAQALANRSKRLLEYVKGCMETAEVQRIECPHFRLSIAKKPPSVEIFEPGLLPAEYMRQPETPPAAPDKIAIVAAIKNGAEIPGARLVHSTRLAVL